MKPVLQAIGGWARDETGAAAVEFAMVFGAFVMFIVGSFYVAGMLFVGSSMQFAVEAAARCASVNTTTCSDDPTTVTYANSKYTAAHLATPVFVSSSTTCGHRVTASVTYVLDMGMTKMNVPLTSAACFP